MSHVLLRVENTGNVYDPTNSPEGRYNITICGSENDIVENIYDHSSENHDTNQNGDILSEYDTHRLSHAYSHICPDIRRQPSADMGRRMISGQIWE
jgi:uncharacterized protein (UPF0262 family)